MLFSNKQTWYHQCLLQPRRQRPAPQIQPRCHWWFAGPEGSGWEPRVHCCWGEMILSALICARLVLNMAERDELGILFKVKDKVR